MGIRENVKLVARFGNYRLNDSKVGYKSRGSNQLSFPLARDSLLSLHSIADTAIHDSPERARSIGAKAGDRRTQRHQGGPGASQEHGLETCHEEARNCELELLLRESRYRRPFC